MRNVHADPACADESHRTRGGAPVGCFHRRSVGVREYVDSSALIVLPGVASCTAIYVRHAKCSGSNTRDRVRFLKLAESYVAFALTDVRHRPACRNVYSRRLTIL